MDQRTRRRGVALLAATLPLLGALLAPLAHARNVGLLVGVGQFADPSLSSQQLLGTAADIDAVQAALSARWNFAPADLLVLRDGSATHERILDEISALEQRSRPGDTALIYFSGHGTSANADGNSFDLPYATGAWVPYDLDYGSVAAAQRTLIIGRRDLVPRLKRLDQAGRHVVVVSDSCYSGQVVRAFGQKFSRSRYLPLRMRDLGVALTPSLPAARPPPPPYPYTHVVLLSGASDSETGADISSPQALQEAPTLDGKYHGAFTDAFLRLLDGRLLSGAFNYVQGREAMNAFLEHRNFAQHPQLLPALAEDVDDIGSAPFLGAAPSAPGSAVSASSATTLRLRLDSVQPGLRSALTALPGVAIVTVEGDLSVRQEGDRVQLSGAAGDPILRTAAADPHLLKRVAAQAWLNRVLPHGDGGLGLRAETSPGTRGNTFVQCESFTFEVRLQKAAYVMLLDLDPQGNLSVLYPTAPAERAIVAAGVPKAIPGTDPKDRILVTAPFGTDAVTVFGFETQPEFFAALTGAERFSADGARAAELERGLKQLSGATGTQHVDVHTYAGASAGLCGGGR